jgi:hypothetical protein
VTALGKVSQQHRDPDAERAPLRWASVQAIRDVGLLVPKVADSARNHEGKQLKTLWEGLQERIGELPSADLRAVTRQTFDAFCDSAAHRRIRRRQLLILAYATAALLATVPTVALIVLTVDPADPRGLFAYGGTALALALPAWWALRSRRALGILTVGACAVLLTWAAWTASAPATWWDLRPLLSGAATDRQRLTAGLALGAALTVQLIVLALVFSAVLVLVSRTRPGGGSTDVRAFDHLLVVVQLLLVTPTVPGDGRRRKIDEALREASRAVVLMARNDGQGGADAGRENSRELKDVLRDVARGMREPNPLLGLSVDDERILDNSVACMMAICRGQLGEMPRAPKTASRFAWRPSSAVRRNLRRIVGAALPGAVFVVAWQIGIPMHDAIAPALGAFAVGILMIGLFRLVYPDHHRLIGELRKLIVLLSTLVVNAQNGPGQGGDTQDGDTQDGDTQDGDTQDGDTQDGDTQDRAVLARTERAGGNPPAQRSTPSLADAAPTATTPDET